MSISRSGTVRRHTIGIEDDLKKLLAKLPDGQTGRRNRRKLIKLVLSRGVVKEEIKEIREKITDVINDLNLCVEAA